MMKHMILQTVQEKPVESIVTKYFNHPCTVTSEALSVLSSLNKPPTGFTRVTLENWERLDDKVSPDEAGQFTQHCQNLQKLHVEPDEGMPEAHRQNFCDLAAKIIEAQA